MCGIKSFEDLLERFSAEDAAKHISDCADCSAKYSSMFELLYPELPMERTKFAKRSLWSRSLLFRMSPVAAAIVLSIAVSLFFMKPSAGENGTNGYSSLSYNDCLEIMDNIDDEEFVEIINSVQEGL